MNTEKPNTDKPKKLHPPAPAYNGFAWFQRTFCTPQRHDGHDKKADANDDYSDCC